MNTQTTRNDLCHSQRKTTAASASLAFALCVWALLVGVRTASGDGPAPPTLAIGAAAPDFCLQGIDDQKHCLQDYASSKVLVLVFT
jgi:hypothetical protein